MDVFEESLYFDTSALLPYYREEAVSEKAESMLQTDASIFISRLTEVEFFSALARWQRMAELTQEEAEAIHNKFEDHLESGLYGVQPMKIAVYEQAKHGLSQRKTALRTLDALHLACAYSSCATLITADEKLSKAAKVFNVDYQYLQV